ncbi:hypothetical protein COY00_03840 [Candidatus Pacearchaeota archaeon CG_4_10_14_0_2_um_filter_35_33]|nr:MAG: hypothetical protein AUJ63_03945 [Candidatus Pacearchaeota archaeon CG1_02_35_32]PIY81707.1 MAG: hypothetical protein COY79_01375 [Candidatus Pacearchaeota archaeon CG_4_10_14_0_8_um_filter_35_169]PIZ79525.1 MAG: hypothetical protein COY00_03840 [Candidatus Pacearchaeota archaeon CG_4_10_14_0_2_um_filter_35_33]PJB94006.1 MAG: hypothetical protein CO081_03290 [Candidatus Pacearchaeota archaeon CG_4_9_14_0_8_um_filter_35_24]
MEVQDTRETRLREIYTDLQSEEFSNRLKGSRLDLVVEGIRLVNQYGNLKEASMEVQDLSKYIFEQATSYMEGSDPFIRSRLMKVLSE